MKSVTVTLLALLLAVSIANPIRDSERTMMVKDNTVNTGEPSELRKRIVHNKEIKRKAEAAFESSRTKALKKQVVLQYARWYARNKMKYTPEQWRKVRDMWYKESRWDWEAVNPSGAKGIAQVKTKSDIPSPFRQVEIGFEYINHRYGGPDAAAAHWDKHGNY